MVVTVLGQQYQYTPQVSKEAYFKATMKGLVKGYFVKSVLNALSFIVEENNISAQDLEMLWQQIKKTGNDPFCYLYGEGGIRVRYFWA